MSWPTVEVNLSDTEPEDMDYDSDETYISEPEDHLVDPSLLQSQIEEEISEDSTVQSFVPEQVNPELLNSPVVNVNLHTNTTALCRTPKNVICDQSKMAKSPDSDDEGQTCTICFEPWSNSGHHRLAALKCGHLFGHSCIQRWIKGQGSKCPQCNTKAVKKDIRVLYAKSVKVIDTTERDQTMKELEKEREVRRRLEMEHAQTKVKYELRQEQLLRELEILKRQASSMGSAVLCSTSTIVGPTTSSGTKLSGLHKKLIMHTSVEVSKEGGCRVAAYNGWLNMVVVSVPSHVSMFPGFGIKKLNSTDMRVDQYLPLHRQQVRDLAFHPLKHDLLLSVGMDKIARVTNVISNASVISYELEHPLWSCCWSIVCSTQFFVGTNIGMIVQYDTRQMHTPIRSFTTAGHGPVTSVRFLSAGNGNHDSGHFPSGVIVARLNSCSFVEIKEADVRDHTLPIEGSFNGVSVHPSTRHALVSCRPSGKFPHARQVVYALTSVDLHSDESTEPNRVVTSNVIHSFQGGTVQKVMSRSCLFSSTMSPDRLLAAASDESTGRTSVYDVSSGVIVEHIKNVDTVMDILSVDSPDGEYLALLTERYLKLYKWV